MIKDYRTTIGGAFSALGSTLIGIGVVPQLSGAPSKFLTYVAVAGFFFDAIGKFFGHLFSADAKDVAAVQKEVDTSLHQRVDATSPKP